uniref:Putative transposase n=2 Tax=Ascobolus immersus TaxID=5191 RepID=Q92199_ASCIM|nr:putative transposase [Ascobolus immersus]
MITSTEFLNIIMYLAACSPEYSVVRRVMPKSATTVTSWIASMFEREQKHIVDYFQEHNIGQINLSFDLWKGPNNRYYLAVVGHWFDAKAKKVRHSLLALRNLQGAHTGENQGVLLWRILQDFKITGLLGWFTLDSGAYNGVTLRWLAEQVETEHGWTFLADERYIRCFGHTLNLIVEAFLIGTHYTNLKRALNDIARERQNITANGGGLTAAQQRREFELQEDLEMAEWRKTGALGKLRNIIMFITRSHHRRELFITVVRRCKADGSIPAEVKAELLVVPNDTRWGSTFEAITRAQKLKPAVQQFLNLQRTAGSEDELSTADWQTLSLIAEILQPFRTFTLCLEGNRENGALYDIVRLFETLRKELTKAYHKHLTTRPLLVSSLDFAIRKLNSYYNFTRLPPVVFASVALHPELKMRYYEAVYRDDHEKLELVRSKVDQVWAEYYQQFGHGGHSGEESGMYPDFKESQAQESQGLSATESQIDDATSFLFDNWKSEFPGSASQLGGEGGEFGFNELEAFLSEPCQKVPNPVEWWIVNQDRFPLLSKLALNILSIPAMSAECERVFSNAKLILTERRRTIGDEALEANQVLRAWIRAGLTTSDRCDAVLSALRAFDSDYRRQEKEEETASEADDDDEL